MEDFKVEPTTLKYTKLALETMGISVTKPTLEKTLIAYEKAKQLGGQMTLKDVAEIESQIDAYYEEEQKLSDMVS